MCSPSRLLLLMAIISALVLSEIHGKKKEKSENDDKPSTSGRKGRGIWLGGGPGTGMDHGHGHGWMKLHNDRHHDHSSKLSEAYVKFHGLGEKGNKGGGGILGRLGNVLNRLGIGRTDPDEDRDNQSGGWGSSSNGNNGGNSGSSGGGGGWGGSSGGGGVAAQNLVTVSIQRPRPGGGGGGWGAPPSMIQMQSGWNNPQMQMVVAQPTGWASASQSQNSHGGSGNDGAGSGGSKGGNGGNSNSRPVGWASGDFQTFKPPRGNRNREKGHFQLNFPTGRPAYIQKLKPIIDLPKIALHGWRR